MSKPTDPPTNPDTSRLSKPQDGKVADRERQASDAGVGSADDAPAADRPRPLRTGRYSSEDLMPPPAAPARRSSSSNSPASAASEAGKAGAGSGSFQAVDVPAIKAQMSEGRRGQALPAAAAPPPASFEAADVRGLQAKLAQERQSKTPRDSIFSRAFSGKGPRMVRNADADQVIDVEAREFFAAPPSPTPSAPAAPAVQRPPEASAAAKTAAKTAEQAKAASSYRQVQGPAAAAPRAAAAAGAGAAMNGRAPSPAAAAVTRRASPSGAPRWTPLRPQLDPRVLRQCLLALLASGAGAFMLTLGWTFFGAWGVLPLALLFTSVLMKLAGRFEAQGRATPAGLAALMATLSFPLIVYFVQHGLGLWPVLQALPPSTYGKGIVVIDWRLVAIDLGTLAFAWFAFTRHRHPLLLLAVLLALWYTLVEVGSFVMSARGLDLSFLSRVSGAFGLCALGGSLWLARTLKKLEPLNPPTAQTAAPSVDISFWLYLVGALMLWASLWSYGPNNEPTRIAHALANLVLAAAGVGLRRRLLLGLGLAGLLLHLLALLTGYLSPLDMLVRLISGFGI